MRDNKKDEDEKTSGRKALERRVDAMMDPKLPDIPDVPDESDEARDEPATEPRLRDDTPDDDTTPPGTKKSPTKTAPHLSTKLRKQIGVSDESAKPISIAKLDELTEKISESEPDEPEAPESPEPEAPETPDPEESESSAGIMDEDTDLDDARTDEAVDDIVSHEGDVMLAVVDSTAAERNRRITEASGQKNSKGAFAAFMWFLVFAVAVIAIVLGVLLVTGGNVNGLKKL